MECQNPSGEPEQPWAKNSSNSKPKKLSRYNIDITRSLKHVFQKTHRSKSTDLAIHSFGVIGQLMNLGNQESTLQSATTAWSSLISFPRGLLTGLLLWEWKGTTAMSPLLAPTRRPWHTQTRPRKNFTSSYITPSSLYHTLTIYSYLAILMLALDRTIHHGIKYLVIIGSERKTQMVPFC